MHSWTELEQAARAIAEIMGGCGVMIGALRSASILRPFLDHVQTIRELNKALELARLKTEEAKRNADTAESWQITATMWQSRYEALELHLKEIKDELAATVLYLTDLIVYLKSGGKVENLPQIPSSLRALLQALHDRLDPKK